MFRGIVDPNNNRKLQNIVQSINCSGIDRLINSVFSPEITNRRLLRTQYGTLLIFADFFLYKTCGSPNSGTNISECYKLLQFAESLQRFESSKFIIAACKYYHSIISRYAAQYAAQYLPPPTTINKTYNLHKRFHRHLEDGIRTDAVSGWLLFASYYYVIGQYKASLRLIEYILYLCTHNKLHLRCVMYNEEEMNSYRQHVNFEITFNERIKLATVCSVNFLRRSPFIPEELQLEVEERSMYTPPFVLSYCLRFLCHHHLGDILNKHKALHNLFVTIKDRHFVPSKELSDSLTILGVCYEISGDKIMAYLCYDDALHCEKCVCPTAEARTSNLSSALPYTFGTVKTKEIIALLRSKIIF